MKIKNIIGFTLASMLLFGGLTTLTINNQKEVIVEEAQAWDLDVTPNVDVSYYSTCDGKTGTALTSALAAINKPTNKSYDWSRYEAADEAQDDSTCILSIYTRHNIKKTSHCGNYAWDKWNREHVYTQSAFPNSDTDNHNIFACEGQINGYRSSKKFAEGGQVVTVFGHTTDCYMTSDTFEPCDEAKGEIARACMYCTIYYGYTLPQIFDSVATAIKWHAEHPVTPREIYRNNTVYGLQGNRNPFVDHPSYANAIWGANYTDEDPIDSEPADPVAVTGVSVNPTSLDLEVGQTGTVTATVAPSNATNKKVTWSTGNSSIATVNNGVVTAIGEGETSITVTTNDGNFVANCVVRVSPKSTPVDPDPITPDPDDPGTNPDPVDPGTDPDPINPDPDDGGQGGGEEQPKTTAKLTSLEVTTPSKVSYKVGEQLDLTGFKAVAKYDDNSTKDVTDKVELDSVNMNKAGSKFVIVSYSENGVKVNAKFDITVSEGSAVGCHGSIIATSAIISLTSLLGVGLLLMKKKR